MTAITQNCHIYNFLLKNWGNGSMTAIDKG